MPSIQDPLRPHRTAIGPPGPEAVGDPSHSLASSPAAAPGEPEAARKLRAGRRPAGRLSRASSVCALIPHYRCEAWLAQCLTSLLQQTRPLDAIAVIDDGSEVPPLAIAGHYPLVTLLGAPENMGPYRLVQQVIASTGYDAFLFQDADDWSTPDRLETLLAEAERTGAELVGSQVVPVACDEREVRPVEYPRDGNDLLARKPASMPVLHPTSLVARDLVLRVGGFATALRFSADNEFQRRCGYVARIVNVPQALYHQRHRPGSLTSAPDTHLRSPARLQLRSGLVRRALENAERAAAGLPPDLTPYAVAEPIELRHLQGPPLRPAPPSTEG